MEELKSMIHCKGCGLPLREIQVQTMLGNPKYTEWCREGYCSFKCFEAHGPSAAQAESGIREAGLTKRPTSELPDSTPLTETVALIGLAKTTMDPGNKEDSPRIPPIPKAVRLYGTGLVVGSLAYIGFILFAMSRGVRGGIPNLAFGLIMAQTGRQFRQGKRAGILWLAAWLILGPVFVLFGLLPPAETEMSARFFFLALLGLPAIVMAIRHWDRFS